jgi:hypothetical protein
MYMSFQILGLRIVQFAMSDLFRVMVFLCTPACLLFQKVVVPFNNSSIGVVEHHFINQLKLLVARSQSSFLCGLGRDVGIDGFEVC